MVDALLLTCARVSAGSVDTVKQRSQVFTSLDSVKPVRPAFALVRRALS